MTTKDITKDITKLAILVEYNGKIYHVKNDKKYNDYIFQLINQLNCGIELFPINIDTIKFEEVTE